MRRIVNVAPAPRYAKIPARAFDSLQQGRIGKGELVTLMQLALYVPGEHPEPVGGTTGEWVEVLGIGERTFQMHIPRLGSSGDLAYLRPQTGYWIVLGLLFGPEDSDHPPEIAGNPKKVAGPVVVSLSDLESDHPLTADEQQQSVQSLPANPQKFAGDPQEFSGDDRTAYLALVSLDMDGGTAAHLVAGWNPAYVLDVVGVARRRGDIDNPAGWVKRAIEGEWVLPELCGRWHRRREREPADYLVDGVQW